MDVREGGREGGMNKWPTIDRWNRNRILEHFVLDISCE